jgi:6-phosphogluconolactonase
MAGCYRPSVCIAGARRFEPAGAPLGRGVPSRREDCRFQPNPSVIVDSPEVVVDTIPALAAGLRQRLEVAARQGLDERGRFSLVLPGGSVAEAFLPALADAAVDWPRIDAFWGDERAVSPDHVDSNYALARRGLLARVSPRVHRMRGEAADLAAAAADYEREMREALGDPPRLDFVMMGMGPDGHVCSLFPGHPLLGETTRWVAVVEDSPKPPSRRLTMTLPALALSDVLVVGAFGRAKAEPARAALRDLQSSLPVALAARAARRPLFLLDPDAAQDLG